jgi:hypothetical protein
MAGRAGTTCDTRAPRSIAIAGGVAGRNVVANRTNRRSQSVQLKRRVMEGVVVSGVEIAIGAHEDARRRNCLFKFRGERPRVGLTYTRRGIWIGRYAE